MQLLSFLTQPDEDFCSSQAVKHLAGTKRVLKNLGHVKEFRQRVQLSSTLLLLLQISSCRKRQTEDDVSRHNMALGKKSQVFGIFSGRRSQ